MKKVFSLFTVALLLLAIIPFSAFSVSAKTYTDDQGITYTLAVDGRTYEVTDCKESVVSVSVLREYEGVIVTTIKSSAFKGCKNLKSIQLPDTIISVEQGAFEDCENLKDIYCLAASKPASFDSSWNSGCNAAVHWGTSMPENDGTGDTSAAADSSDGKTENSKNENGASASKTDVSIYVLTAVIVILLAVIILMVILNKKQNRPQ